MNAQKLLFAVRLCTGGLLGGTLPVGAVSNKKSTPQLQEVKG